MLTGRNITQLIRLSAWNVVYCGRYTVALQRLACKRNRPFYYLHQYDGLVNRRACRGILENIQGLNFSGWGFYLLGSGIKQGYHNKKPSLLRDSRPNPVLVNPQSTDWLLTRVFQALYLLVDKFWFIRVCETIVTSLTVRFLTLVYSQTKPAPRNNFPLERERVSSCNQFCLQLEVGLSRALKLNFFVKVPYFERNCYMEITMLRVKCMF